MSIYYTPYIWVLAASYFLLAELTYFQWTLRETKTLFITLISATAGLPRATEFSLQHEC